MKTLGKFIINETELLNEAERVSEILFPISRSITGNGVRKTLEIISKFLPISYAFNSTKLTIINKVSIEEIIFDLTILFVFSAIFIIASSLVVNSQKNNK